MNVDEEVDKLCIKYGVLNKGCKYSLNTIQGAISDLVNQALESQERELEKTYFEKGRLLAEKQLRDVHAKAIKNALKYMSPEDRLKFCSENNINKGIAVIQSEGL